MDSAPAPGGWANSPGCRRRIGASQRAGPTVLSGTMLNLPWIAAEPGILEALPWDAWAAGTHRREFDAIPWHFLPREWVFRVRGFDERLHGRGCMDNDLSDRAERDPSVRHVRLFDPFLALHFPHERVRWSESLATPETQRNLQILRTDLSVVRNDDTWTSSEPAGLASRRP